MWQVVLTANKAKYIPPRRKYCIPGDPSMHPFNVITLDLITQLPKVNGYDAILTVVDQGCSRAAIFLPCNTTITREGVALLYL